MHMKRCPHMHSSIMRSLTLTLDEPANVGLSDADASLRRLQMQCCSGHVESIQLAGEQLVASMPRSTIAVLCLPATGSSNPRRMALRVMTSAL
jgi:hypothetical protein